MTDPPRAGTGDLVPGTVAPGRERPGVGIVWLDRLSLVASDRRCPSFGPRAAVMRSVPAAVQHLVTDGAEAATVGATVEMPPGYLLVDVRVGYARAARGFVGELRVVDLRGHRKSALVLLERRQAGGPAAANLFVDAPTAPARKRTLLSVRASVVDGAHRVAAHGLRVCLTQP